MWASVDAAAPRRAPVAPSAVVLRDIRGNSVSIEMAEVRLTELSNRASSAKSLGHVQDACALYSQCVAELACLCAGRQRTDELLRPLFRLRCVCLKALGALEAGQGRLVEALPLLLQAAEDDARDVALWYHIASVALRLRVFGQSRLALETALSLSPRHLPSASLLQQVMFHTEDWPSLRALSDRCLSAGVNRAQSLLYKAHVARVVLAETVAEAESNAVLASLLTSQALALDATAALPPQLDGGDLSSKRARRTLVTPTITFPSLLLPAVMHALSSAYAAALTDPDTSISLPAVFLVQAGKEEEGTGDGTDADLGPVLVPVIDLSTSETSAPAVSALPSPQAVVVVDADSPEVKLTQEAVLEATEPASVEHTQEATQPATVEPIQEATQPATVEPAQEAAHSAAVETTQVAAGEGGSVEATQVAEAGAAQVGTVEATEGASVRAPKPSDKVSTRSSKRSTARQTPAAGGDANTAGLSTGVASRDELLPFLLSTSLMLGQDLAPALSSCVFGPLSQEDTDPAVGRRGRVRLPAAATSHFQAGADHAGASATNSWLPGLIDSWTARGFSLLQAVCDLTTRVALALLLPPGLASSSPDLQALVPTPDQAACVAATAFTSGVKAALQDLLRVAQAHTTGTGLGDQVALFAFALLSAEMELDARMCSLAAIPASAFEVPAAAYSAVSSDALEACISRVVVTDVAEVFEWLVSCWNDGSRAPGGDADLAPPSSPLAMPLLNVLAPDPATSRALVGTCVSRLKWLLGRYVFATAGDSAAAAAALGVCGRALTVAGEGACSLLPHVEADGRVDAAVLEHRVGILDRKHKADHSRHTYSQLMGRLCDRIKSVASAFVSQSKSEFGDLVELVAENTPAFAVIRNGGDAGERAKFALGLVVECVGEWWGQPLTTDAVGVTRAPPSEPPAAFGLTNARLVLTRVLGRGVQEAEALLADVCKPCAMGTGIEVAWLCALLRQRGDASANRTVAGRSETGRRGYPHCQDTFSLVSGALFGCGRFLDRILWSACMVEDVLAVLESLAGHGCPLSPSQLLAACGDALPGSRSRVSDPVWARRFAAVLTDALVYLACHLLSALDHWVVSLVGCTGADTAYDTLTPRLSPLLFRLTCFAARIGAEPLLALALGCAALTGDARCKFACFSGGLSANPGKLLRHGPALSLTGQLAAWCAPGPVVLTASVQALVLRLLHAALLPHAQPVGVFGFTSSSPTSEQGLATPPPRPPSAFGDHLWRRFASPSPSPCDTARCSLVPFLLLKFEVADIVLCATTVLVGTEVAYPSAASRMLASLCLLHLLVHQASENVLCHHAPSLHPPLVQWLPLLQATWLIPCVLEKFSVDVITSKAGEEFLVGLLQFLTSAPLATALSLTDDDVSRFASKGPVTPSAATPVPAAEAPAVQASVAGEVAGAGEGEGADEVRASKTEVGEGESAEEAPRGSKAGLWCRYCGARESSGFNRGPWGSRTLCTPHYVKWAQKKTLKLSDWPKEPTEAINPAENTEGAYLEAMRKKYGTGGKKTETVAAAPAPTTISPAHCLCGFRSDLSKVTFAELLCDVKGNILAEVMVETWGERCRLACLLFKVLYGRQFNWMPSPDLNWSSPRLLEIATEHAGLLVMDAPGRCWLFEFLLSLYDDSGEGEEEESGGVTQWRAPEVKRIISEQTLTRHVFPALAPDLDAHAKEYTVKGALAAGGVWFRLMPVAAVAASSSGPPTLDPNDLGITQDSQLTLRQLQRIALVLHPGRQQRVIDGLDNRECRGLDVLSRMFDSRANDWSAAALMGVWEAIASCAAEPNPPPLPTPADLRASNIKNELYYYLAYSREDKALTVGDAWYIIHQHLRDVARSPWRVTSWERLAVHFRLPVDEATAGKPSDRLLARVTSAFTGWEWALDDAWADAYPLLQGTSVRTWQVVHMVTAALRHATRVSSRAAVVLWLTSLQHQGGPLIPHVPTLCSSSSTGVKEIQDFCGALEGHPLFTHAGVTATLRSACSSPRRALLDDVFLCIVDACGDMYREAAEVVCDTSTGSSYREALLEDVCGLLQTAHSLCGILPPTLTLDDSHSFPAFKRNVGEVVTHTRSLAARGCLPSSAWASVHLAARAFMKRGEFTAQLASPGPRRSLLLHHALLGLVAACAAAAVEHRTPLAPELHVGGLEVDVASAYYRLHATRCKLLVAVWDTVTNEELGLFEASANADPNTPAFPGPPGTIRVFALPLLGGSWSFGVERVEVTVAVGADGVSAVVGADLPAVIAHLRKVALLAQCGDSLAALSAAKGKKPMEAHRAISRLAWLRSVGHPLLAAAGQRICDALRAGGVSLLRTEEAPMATTRPFEIVADQWGVAPAVAHLSRLFTWKQHYVDVWIGKDTHRQHEAHRYKYITQYLELLRTMLDLRRLQKFRSTYKDVQKTSDFASGCLEAVVLCAVLDVVLRLGCTLADMWLALPASQLAEVSQLPPGEAAPSVPPVLSLLPSPSPSEAPTLASPPPPRIAVVEDARDLLLTAYDAALACAGFCQKYPHLRAGPDLAVAAPVVLVQTQGMLTHIRSHLPLTDGPRGALVTHIRPGAEVAPAPSSLPPPAPPSLSWLPACKRIAALPDFPAAHANALSYCATLWPGKNRKQTRKRTSAGAVL